MPKSKETSLLASKNKIVDNVQFDDKTSKSNTKAISNSPERGRSPGRQNKRTTRSRSKGRSRSASRGRTSRVTKKSPSRKSPGRPRLSKSRSPGPARARSGSRSRRIVANNLKQQNSVPKQPPAAEIKKKKEEEEEKEDEKSKVTVKVNATRPLNVTPTTSLSSTNTREGLRPRSSARVAALQTARVAGVVTPGLIAEGMEEVDSKVNQIDGKTNNKSSKKVLPSQNIIGTLWTVVFTFLTAPVIFSVYLMCNKQSCSVTKLPVFPVRLSSYVDIEAISIFFGWLAFQAVLYALPIGRLVDGQPLRDGSRLKYRMNGMFALVVSIGSLSSILYYYPRVANLVYQKQVPIFITSTVFSYLLALLLYVKSRWTPVYRLNSLTNNRSFIYGYFMGRELNPRPLGFELKLFLELRPGVIGWAALNVIYVWKDYVDHGGDMSHALLLSASLQILYVVDALWFEETVLTTLDVTTEGLGFMLVFGDLSFVTLVFTTESRFLLEHRRVLPWYALVAIAALFVVGYVIFRASYLQKDVFRRMPFSPKVALLDTINTGSPKKILAGGWWGWVRHPNYFGDLLIGLSFCLPTDTEEDNKEMPNKKKKKYNARFPPARIKKIMQKDEEVGKVAAAVPVIIYLVASVPDVQGEDDNSNPLPSSSNDAAATSRLTVTRTKRQRMTRTKKYGGLNAGPSHTGTEEDSEDDEEDSEEEDEDDDEDGSRSEDSLPSTGLPYFNHQGFTGHMYGKPSPNGIPIQPTSETTNKNLYGSISVSKLDSSTLDEDYDS